MKIALALIIGLVIAFFAYSSISNNKGKQHQTVYYYPEANVYLNRNSGEYFFYQQAQKAWIATEKLSKNQVSALGEPVELPLQTPIWRENAHHRMVNSISLYAKPALVKSHYREDSLKMLPATNTEKEKEKEKEKEEKEEKPKKGLKKFFDKLFGKKDKSEDS